MVTRIETKEKKLSGRTGSTRQKNPPRRGVPGPIVLHFGGGGWLRPCAHARSENPRPEWKEARTTELSLRNHLTFQDGCSRQVGDPHWFARTEVIQKRETSISVHDISLARKVILSVLLEGKKRRCRGCGSHQVGTVRGILTVVCFKNQKDTAVADPIDSRVVGLTAKP